MNNMKYTKALKHELIREYASELFIVHIYYIK
ncbi:hypothetical protein ICY_02490 [Bacillus cereus BAG2X1-3]|nr:hypothetical protein ICU_02655 [Bacillus cereus BAG2X1-1]EJS76154.1 hypothetical protein ICY_02490 [Bacillus cereus BAG2X1-3]